MELQAKAARHPLAVTCQWVPVLSTSTLLQTVLLAVVFLLNFFPDTDPDLWWHMATGRYIVETGSVPTSDPFSYTATGKPWVAHEWLAEAIIYLIYRSGGYLPLVLLFGAMTTLAFGFTLRTLRLLGLRPVAATCVTLWVALMSLFSWDVRPQIFSYLLFAVYLYLLLRSRQHAEPRLWLLPMLMALWVNLHGGYVMGLLLIAAFLAGEGINRWKPPAARAGGSGLDQAAYGEAGSSPTPHALGTTPASRCLDPHSSVLAAQAPSLRTYLAVFAATVAATVVNPQGPTILLYPFTYAGTANASMRFITEWQSPDFHYYYFFIFASSLMALMVAPARSRADWALAIPLLLLTAMSLQSVRVIPFYGIGAAPFLGLRLAPHGGRSPATTPPTTPTPRRVRATRWNWLVLLLCLATMGSTLFLSDRTQWGPEPRTSSYPAEGVRYIRESGLRGNLFNTFHWGGFLIWSFYPERRVFVDGRPDMYGDQFMEEYQLLQDVRPGWRELLDKHRVEVALVEKDGRTATLLLASGEWRELFRGEIESVLVRQR